MISGRSGGGTSAALQVKVRELTGWVRTVETRMPFRYGSACLRRNPHLYLFVEIEDAGGRAARGVAADNLPPKWFDKSPGKTFVQELREQLAVIGWAAQLAQEHERATPFQIWWDVYQAVQARAEAHGLPALLAGFGPSLVERAIQDAVGRLLGLPFHQLLRQNVLGIELGRLDPQLAGLQPADVLPAEPLPAVHARHTVGLSDPLRDADIPPEERLDDGLPQSLEAVVRTYGNRYFKIKVRNGGQEDVDRLVRIAEVLDASPEPYYVTLDGNEQYPSVDALEPLIQALQTHPRLRRLSASILFIEQPLARDAALDPERCRGLAKLARWRPVLIDESDATLDAFPRALALGYAGTSHKSCKNVTKSLLNLARAQCCRQERHPGTVAPFLSAEDLTTIGPVSLHQDLAAVATLGIPHVERNGHHYYGPLSFLPPAEREAVLAAYPHLYRPHADGAPLLVIEDGQIDCRDLFSPGQGVRVLPGTDGMMPMQAYDPAQAGLE